MTNLTYLELSGNSITDISPLRGLTNLTWLWFSSSNLSDISALRGLTSLTYMNLSNNNLTDTDISSLSGLINLTGLNLGSNRITDISSLQTLTSLTRKAMATLTGTSRGVTVAFDSLSVARLVKVSGDGQIGTASAALAKPFVVKVQSANDTTYAYRNLPVTFSVTPGGGSLSTTSDTTDVNGLARTRLTLGETVGMDTVKAFVEGASDTLIFTTLSPLPTPDFDGNGRVNFADFLALGNKMGSGRDRGSYEARYDLDGDGEIGMSDFRILTSRFGDGKFDDAK